MRKVLGAVAAAVVALVFATPVAADWTTYHYDNTHSGNDTSASPVAGSGIAWTSPNLNGDVTAEPLYFNGVVYVTTMQDWLYALNPADGTVLWSYHIDTAYDTGTNPLPCGNDFSFIGIMGTPVIDPATSTLYAVGMVTDGTYHLWAINLNTHGTVYAPVVLSASAFDAAVQNQRGALTFYNGQVFVPFGGRDGDCGDYHGWVFAVHASDGTGLISYHTPAYGAGMWGRGGGIISNGYYTIATGNAVNFGGVNDQCSTTFKEQNAVLKLTTSLSLAQYWAPTDWSSLSCSDTDIGSTGPSLLVNTPYIFQSGKNGNGYLLSATYLNGIGGEVASTSVCGGESFGGNAWDATNADLFVPCGGELDGFSLSGTAFSSLWTQSITSGAPIVIGGAVWAIDRNGGGLFVYAESNGAQLFNDATLGAVSHGFVSPSFGGGFVYAAGNNGSSIVRAYFAGGWNASYNLTSVPTTWVANQSQTFNVTVTNSGNQPWPHSGANAVMLDMHFTPKPAGSPGMSFWYTSQTYPLPADVAIGASATVSVTVTAPNLSGGMYLEAEMFKNQQFWFQQWQSVHVTVSPPTWTATYDMTLAPSSWTTGQTQTFNVTVTNTGNQTWPHGGTNAVMLDMHFTTVSGGSAQQSHWLTSQTFLLSSDVAPAASATVSVSVTAPSTGGNMSLEAELFKNQQFWFGSSQAVAVSVGVSHWSVAYAVTSPASWVVGQTQSVSVTLTNIGNQTWPHGGSNAVLLDMHFTTSPGGSAHQPSWLTSQTYSLPGDLAPGGSVTLSVSVTAPGSRGGMWLEAELLKNQQFWFPQAKAAPVTVYNHWQATIDLSAAPTSWTAGQSQTFNVTLTNVGDQTWPHGGANLVLLDVNFSTSAGGDAARYCCWLTSQTFALPADLAPGGSVTLSVSVTPPGTGTYYLEAELLKNQQFWFPTWSYVSATVASTWSASYAVTIPPSWVVGQSQSVRVTLTNIGNQTWPSGTANPVELDMHFTTNPGGSAQQSHWLTSQTYVLPSDVAPGGSVTLTASVTAPSSAGSMWLEAELFKNQQFWFPQAKATPVTVYNHWQATIDLSAAPTSWTAGQSQTFNVTLTNVGDQTWPHGGANLVLLDINFSTSAGGDAARYCCWLTSQTFVLPSDVAPGGSVTLSVNVTPPASTGTYYLEAELLKNQQFWFPTWSYVSATVA